MPAIAVAVGKSAIPGPVIWANASALGLLGLTGDEVVGAALTGLIDDVDIVGARDSWVDATLLGPGQVSGPVQVRVQSADQDTVVLLLRSASQELRLAESAQRESEHRFRALAEHAPVGIVVSEAGLRLGFVNARFAQIVGSDPVFLTGIRWLHCVHDDDRPILLASLDDVLAGEPRELTVRLVREGQLEPASPLDRGRDDLVRWVQIRLAPVTTPRRSAGFIGTVEDVTDRRAWENQLSYLAEHDPLTGLANRRCLIEAISQLLGSRRTRDRDAAVLFCDLDGFKQINDTLGHEAGDRVLIEVGQRLLTTARDRDLVARIAGDEFVVLIREIGDVADAEVAAERQLQALQEPIVVAGTHVNISASIGLAMAREYDTAAELLQAADRGMYEAKRAGRGRFRRGQPIRLDAVFDGA